MELPETPNNDQHDRQPARTLGMWLLGRVRECHECRTYDGTMTSRSRSQRLFSVLRTTTRYGYRFRSRCANRLISLDGELSTIYLQHGSTSACHVPRALNFNHLYEAVGFTFIFPLFVGLVACVCSRLPASRTFGHTCPGGFCSAQTTSSQRPRKSQEHDCRLGKQFAPS